MSSSPLMQDLFAAAREDAPSDVVHDQVWGRVAAATAVPAARNFRNDRRERSTSTAA